MKLRSINIIIGLMSVALLGIIVIQVQQIRRTISINQASFNMSISDALTQVVSDLEGSEIVTRFVRVTRALDVENATFSPNELADTGKSVYLSLDENVETPRLRQQRVRIRDSVAIVTETEAQLPFDSTLTDMRSDSYLFFTSDSAGLSRDMSMELRGHPRLMRLVSTALRGSVPPSGEIENRLDALVLDSLLNQALASQGLNLKYDFWVKSSSKNELPIKRLTYTSPEDLQSQHKIELYPYSSSIRKNFLYIKFPNENIYALKNVWVQMALSILFVGIILVCFGVVIQVLFRQKKLSEMKNDFINNMTHELKTPIATISLATDAINNPQVRAIEGGVERYTRIIKEENSRMNRQVERVLLAARLDRKELPLKVVDVDMHEVISTAVRNIQLQIADHGGELHMDCKAINYTVEGDKVHLSNVIYNLLDNANKYSPENPQIYVRTSNEDGNFVVEVEDNGMGISKQNLQQIFTRFYRVSTGNLHEVKGFGLGLSYVKDITEAHEGKVGVKSILGKGSTFSLSLPLQEKA